MIWEELVTFNTFKYNYDDDINLPELIKEWLDEDELKDRLEMEERELNNRGSIGKNNYKRNDLNNVYSTQNPRKE